MSLSVMGRLTFYPGCQATEKMHNTVHASPRQRCAEPVITQGVLSLCVLRLGIRCEKHS